MRRAVKWGLAVVVLLILVVAVPLGLTLRRALLRRPRLRDRPAAAARAAPSAGHPRVLEDQRLPPRGGDSRRQRRDRGVGPRARLGHRVHRERRRVQSGGSRPLCRDGLEQHERRPADGGAEGRVQAVHRRWRRLRRHSRRRRRSALRMALVRRDPARRAVLGASPRAAVPARHDPRRGSRRPGDAAPAARMGPHRRVVLPSRRAPGPRVSGCSPPWTSPPTGRDCCGSTSAWAQTIPSSGSTASAADAFAIPRSATRRARIRSRRTSKCSRARSRGPRARRGRGVRDRDLPRSVRRQPRPTAPPSIPGTPAATPAPAPSARRPGPAASSSPRRRCARRSRSFEAWFPFRRGRG